MIDEIIYWLAVSVPMFCALFCLLHYFLLEKGLKRKHILLMVGALVCGFFCWMGALIYFACYQTFVSYARFLLLMLMFDQVMLYHSVFVLTQIEPKKSFSLLHYVVPVLLCAIFAVSSVFVPREAREQIYQFNDSVLSTYPYFSSLFLVMVVVVWSYSVFYALFGLRKIKRYRRYIVDYAADTKRINMKWLYIIMSLILLSRFIPMSYLFFQNELLKLLILCLVMIIPVIQYAIITYNFISTNYLIVDLEEEANTPPSEDAYMLNNARFQRYIRKEKPYLNPKLRITDVAAALNTNRSYVSSFINKEYGMNFCRYINRLRLEELDRLRTLPKNVGATNLELVLSAGFSSYRSYLRTKKEENKRGLMKMFD